MTIRDFYRALCREFPEDTRMSDDFDGLQVCPDGSRELSRVVCALDPSQSAIAFAKAQNADLLLCHHPLFWIPTRTLDPDENADARRATALFSASLAFLSLHTRFDAAKGGMSDTLADKLALSDRVAVGHADDPLPLARVGTLPQPLVPEQFAKLCANALQNHVLITDGGQPIRRVFVATGGARDYYDAFLGSGADAFVAGELAHHIRIDGAERGKTILEAGHYGSEFLFCEAITPVVSRLAPGVCVTAFADTPHEGCILPD